MRKAQSSTEFVVLSTVMLLFFSIAFIYLQGLLVDYTVQGKHEQLDAIQASVKDELALAARMPDGYARRFSLPMDIQGIGYNMDLETEINPAYKDALVVTVLDTTSLVYLDYKVSGTLTPGTNTLKKVAGALVFN